MDGYRFKNNSGYQQFADVINKSPFHDLNFDKNFVKYCCKKFKEIYVGLFKTEKRKDVLLLATFWNQSFFVNSKKIYPELLENTSLESILNQNKELISKRDDSERKIWINIFCCKSLLRKR